MCNRIVIMPFELMIKGRFMLSNYILQFQNNHSLLNITTNKASYLKDFNRFLENK